MPEVAELRDIDLMRRLASGDEGAFVEFYRRHQAGVFRYVLHMSGRPESAPDVVQETFLTLMRQAAKFDEERGAPAAFLYGIARNHVRKLFDTEGRYVALIQDPEGAPGSNGNSTHASHANHGQRNGHSGGFASHGDMGTVQDGYERAQMAELLHDTILTLPEHYREPLTLCDLQGKSYSEAAVLLACPVGTVRSRLNRARSILLEKLRPSHASAKALHAPGGGKNDLRRISRGGARLRAYGTA